MVRLQKDDLSSQSWWTPDQPLPPAKRVTLSNQGVPPMRAMTCLQCGHLSPRVYHDSWMCLIATCEFFWTPTSVASIVGSSINQQFLEGEQPGSFDFDEEFLRYRLTFDKCSTKPAYALVPAQLPYFEKMSGPSASQMKMFYSGLICYQCSNIVHKVQWHHWQCSECRWKYDTGNTRIDLTALNGRHFVSFAGHPPFNPVSDERWFGSRREDPPNPNVSINADASS